MMDIITMKIIWIIGIRLRCWRQSCYGQLVPPEKYYMFHELKKVANVATRTTLIDKNKAEAMSTELVMRKFLYFLLSILPILLIKINNQF